jgi:hypothetical protein
MFLLTYESLLHIFGTFLVGEEIKERALGKLDKI